MSSHQTKIAFVGGGNMAAALVQGLLSQGRLKAEHIAISDPDAKKRQNLTELFKVKTYPHNHQFGRVNTLILAVKPQQMKKAIDELQPSQADLIISIAAGIPVAWLESLLPPKQPIIRCMPNTPALIQQGMSVLYANQNVLEDQYIVAEQVFHSVGRVLRVFTEQLLDTVTALSGSGPAYFFYLMEAMIEAAVALGMEDKQARQLCVQTAIGAAQLADEKSTPMAQLRQQVTSKGGTTEAAIAVFDENHIKNTIIQAVTAAKNRSEELAKMIGDNS